MDKLDKLKLMELYSKLPQSERDALDETIMDQGINCLKDLLETVELVETYFEEQ